jgi:hypothetical protein
MASRWKNSPVTPPNAGPLLRLEQTRAKNRPDNQSDKFHEKLVKSLAVMSLTIGVSSFAADKPFLIVFN